MLKLSPLISLSLFALESQLNYRYLVMFFTLILLFFAGCCLRMLIFYVILEFRIDTLPCSCQFVSLRCLFLLLFVICEKYFTTLNFIYLFHVPLLSLTNSIHVKLFHLLQKYYFLELNEQVKRIHSLVIMVLTSLDYFVLINQENLSIQL